MLSILCFKKVYQRDTDMIPKNSRVQINRVVKNIGPAIAGGVITSTHKQNEQLADMRVKQQLQQQQLKMVNELYAPDTDSLPPHVLELKTPALTENSIYSDLINLNEESSNSSNSFEMSVQKNMPVVKLETPLAPQKPIVRI